MATTSVTPNDQPVMVDVFDDQGNKGQIPQDNLQTALSRGFKRAVRVTSPEGEGGWVPLDKAKAAIDRGFKIGQPNQFTDPSPDSTIGTPYEGDARLGRGVKDALTGLVHMPGAVYHAITDPAQTPEEMQSVLHGGGLSLAANRLIGKPMQAQQQKANQTTGVESLGHRAAGSLPFIGPFAGQSGEAIGQDPLRGTGELATNLLLAKGANAAVDNLPLKATASRAVLLGKTPEAAYESALKPSTTLSAAERTQLAQTGLKEGIPVSQKGLEKLSGLIDDVNSQIANKIQSNPNAPINKFKVASRLNATAQKFSNQVSPSSDLGAISDVGNDFLNTAPGEIPASQAQSMKQGTYRALGDKAYGELKGASVEAQKSLARGLKDELAVQFPELNDLNARDGRLLDLQDSLERAVGRIGNHQLLGIGTPIAAGAVKAVSGSGKLGAVAGIMKAVLDNPNVKSHLAIALASKGTPGFLPAARIAAYSAALGKASQPPALPFLPGSPQSPAQSSDQAAK